MGYTHYWNQRRHFTKPEWATITTDIAAILKYAQHDGGIALANGAGDPKTSPNINSAFIMFNGLGDDSHETFYIERRIRKPDYVGRERGFDFCKTARKPYDPVVVACLCYLSTITRADDPITGNPIIGTEAYEISSDGRGADFLSGLDLARKAIPAKANHLDLPMDIMKKDRWCAPWINDTSKNFTAGSKQIYGMRRAASTKRGMIVFAPPKSGFSKNSSPSIRAAPINLRPMFALVKCRRTQAARFVTTLMI